MPVFSYEAVNRDGKHVRGIIDAESPRAAALRLKRDEQVPLRIKEETFHATGTPEVSGWLRFRRHAGLTDTMVITRQLATLLAAGLSVTAALNAMSAQLSNPYLKGVLRNIRERLAEGKSLSAALFGYPDIFSSLYVESVAAGEESGRLKEVLSELADFLDRQIKLRNRLLSALAYPVVMGIAALGVFIILMIYVLPSVSEIFETIHQPLPPVTRLLLFMGKWIENYGIFIPLILAVILILFMKFRKTPRGRNLLDRFWLIVPYIRTWVEKTQIARFSRTLSTILASGIPLVRALRLTQGVISNGVLRASMDGVVQQIGEGYSLGAALNRLSWVPPVMFQMVMVGEEGGDLEGMLLKVAEMYEEETESVLKTILSVMEPVMILFMGGIIGWIVISVLLPIFNMNQFIR
jgi:general secretion pathway protein F